MLFKMLLTILSIVGASTSIDGSPKFFIILSMTCCCAAAAAFLVSVSLPILFFCSSCLLNSTFFKV